MKILKDKVKITMGEMMQRPIEPDVYRKIEGNSSIWYIGIQDNSADYIYCRSKKNSRSDGFGGSTLKFNLDDGLADYVQGPWHSNAIALSNDTRENLMDKYLTFGIVALNRESFNYPVIFFYDVYYIDEVAIIGSFNRLEKIAEDIANKLGVPVNYYIESCGGSSVSIKNPLWMDIAV